MDSDATMAMTGSTAESAERRFTASTFFDTVLLGPAVAPVWKATQFSQEGANR